MRMKKNNASKKRNRARKNVERSLKGSRLLHLREQKSMNSCVRSKKSDKRNSVASGLSSESSIKSMMLKFESWEKQKQPWDVKKLRRRQHWKRNQWDTTRPFTLHCHLTMPLRSSCPSTMVSVECTECASIWVTLVALSLHTRQDSKGSSCPLTDSVYLPSKIWVQELSK